MTDTLKSITGLDNSTTFYWRIRAKNIAGYGEWSDIWTFTTIVALPEKPRLLFPDGDNQPLEISLKWRKVKDTEKYYVHLSTDSAFDNIVTIDSTVTDTLKSLINLNEGQKYFWQVYAKNIVGVGPWSDVWNFTTILKSPTNLTLERTGLKEITLTWDDNSTNEKGYIIEKKLYTDADYVITDIINPVNKYIDNSVEQGMIYLYRVKAFTEFAESDYSNEAGLEVVGTEDDELIPIEYSISQNYPNPFNPTTTIRFGLPKRSNARLTIYDSLGKEITTLIEKEMEAGYHEIVFDASRLTSGIYFYNLTCGSHVSVKKMLLLK